MPPGITGFAQLRLTREMTWAEKLAHDFEYIADRSLRLYFEIVVADGVARAVAAVPARRELTMCGICGIVRADGAAPSTAACSAR